MGCRSDCSVLQSWSLSVPYLGNFLEVLGQSVLKIEIKTDLCMYLKCAISATLDAMEKHVNLFQGAVRYKGINKVAGSANTCAWAQKSKIVHVIIACAPGCLLNIGNAVERPHILTMLFSASSPY